MSKSKRGAARSRSAAAEAESAATPSPEVDEQPSGADPGLVPRLLADNFWIGRIVGTALSAVFGIAILQGLRAGSEIPANHYVYLTIGLTLQLAIAAARRFSPGVQRAIRISDIRKDSDHLVKETRRCLRAHGSRLPRAEVELLEERARAVTACRIDRDWDSAAGALKDLDAALEASLSSQRKSTLREYSESIIVAVLIALVLRAFVVEAFKIPSGSMIPTLEVGDHIFVNKFIYGVRIPFFDVKLGMNLRKPRRGEVVVFKFPNDPDKDFIKRIVAIEGDTVEVIDSALHVNGKPVARERVEGVACSYRDVDELSGVWEDRTCEAWREHNGTHEYTTIFNRGLGQGRNKGSFKVPPATVFVMGDNRDNSHDSRFWGAVPFELIKGKAMIIWLSWGENIRMERLGKLID